ncbi:hypothetical protein WJX82_001283 [Trebouxia sp. C0006]
MRMQASQDVRRLGKTFVLLLLAQTCWMTVAGQDWIDYDDGAYFMSRGTAPGPAPYMHLPHSGAYHRPYGIAPYGPAPYGPLPYGLSPSPAASPPPPPPHSPPPPPPPPTTVVVTEGFSTSTTVPAVKSTATLTNYATVAAFNSTERARFITTLEANILKLLDVLANVTIDSVVASSVSVTDTISFTGADSTAATEARDALVTALTSGDSSIFGTSFGSVTVSSVLSTNSTNTATKSGAGSIGWGGVMGATAAAVLGAMYFAI